MNADRADAVTEKWELGKFLRPALDLKIWGFAMCFGMTTTVSYALAYFLPIILTTGLKFSVGASQCLVAPPYAAAAICMYASAWVGDKYHIRGPLIIANAALAIVGVAVLGWASNLKVRYFGAFLITIGANSNVPAILTFQVCPVSNHLPHMYNNC